MCTKVMRRLDYKPLDFTIDATKLNFTIELPLGKVTSKLQVRRLNPEATSLKLDGQRLTLLDLKINGKEFKDYQLITKEGVDGFLDLLIDVSSLADPDNFEVEITNQFIIEDNNLLMGIYKSENQIISQNEPHGFRLITFYIDRPDCLAKFDVRIEAPKTYKYLLSNGNKVAEGELTETTHFCEWHDPFPKPCYLFALCAADFDVLEDEFVTKSGRKIDLRIYADLGKKDQLHFAMASLKRAMKWDEDRFDLEYDLDQFMIVATPYFNMGAMENKSLNIFNDSCLIGDKDTMDDKSLEFINACVGHEYFHNWTGDRVTCRDWFQLTLKEGLTVFRELEFTSDTVNRTLKRINDVRVVKLAQFNEDRSPLSHPIRPDQVQSQENFYTATVYEKGAEVIRMIHTLLGEKGFQKGMKLYFERHDGKAVTCDDFVDAMQDAGGVDLTSFRKWYSQSGTPQVYVTTNFDPATKVYTLNLRQETKPTHDQAHKEPLFLILKSEFISHDGKVLTGLKTVDGQAVPELITFDTDSIEYKIAGLDEEPIFATNLDFSSPVEVHLDYSFDELCTIAHSSTDYYARYDAAERINALIYKDNLERLAKGEELHVPEQYIELNRHFLTQSLEEPGFYSQVVSFTRAGEFLLTQTKDARPLDNLKIQRFVDNALYQANGELALEIYQKLPRKPYEFSYEQISLRCLKATLLGLITLTGEHKDLVVELYNSADNFTDRETVLMVDQKNNLGLKELQDAFFERYKGDNNALATLLTIRGKQCNSVADIQEAFKFPSFDVNNPNRVQELFKGIASNLEYVYGLDSDFLPWIKDFILQVDKSNSSLSSGLAKRLISFQRLADPWKSRIVETLVQMEQVKDLSLSLNEIIETAVASVKK